MQSYDAAAGRYEVLLDDAVAGKDAKTTTRRVRAKRKHLVTESAVALAVTTEVRSSKHVEKGCTHVHCGW